MTDGHKTIVITGASSGSGEGPARAMQAALPSMRAAGSGPIVKTGSVAGRCRRLITPTLPPSIKEPIQ